MGSGDRTHVNSKGKIPSIGKKNLLRGGSNPPWCNKQDSETNTLPTSYPDPTGRCDGEWMTKQEGGRSNDGEWMTKLEGGRSNDGEWMTKLVYGRSNDGEWMTKLTGGRSNDGEWMTKLTGGRSNDGEWMTKLEDGEVTMVSG